MGKDLEERLEAAIVAGDRADNRVVDRGVLRYAGVLGHTYVVVINCPADLSSRGRRVALETCDRMSAVSSATGEFSEKSPTVYKQVKRGCWKRVFGKVW